MKYILRPLGLSATSAFAYLIASGSGRTWVVAAVFMACAAALALGAKAQRDSHLRAGWAICSTSNLGLAYHSATGALGGSSDSRLLSLVAVGSCALGVIGIVVVSWRRVPRMTLPGAINGAITFLCVMLAVVRLGSWRVEGQTAFDTLAVAFVAAAGIWFVGSTVLLALAQGNRFQGLRCLQASNVLLVNSLAIVVVTDQPTSSNVVIVMTLLASVAMACAAHDPSSSALSERCRGRDAVGLVERFAFFALGVVMLPICSVLDKDPGKADSIELLVVLSLIGMTIMSVFLMVAQQRGNERLLAARLEQNASLVEIGHLALIEKSAEHFLEVSASMVADALGARYVAFFESPFGDSLALAAIHGMNDVDEDAGLLTLDADIDAVHAYAHRRVERFGDNGSSTKASLAAFSPDEPVRSGLCVPIEGPARPLGVLAVYDTTASRFVESDADFLQSVANITGSTLARLSSEGELQQSQKLESVGRLAAGIAHEINTPIQFVGDNLHFLKDAFESVAALVDAEERTLRELTDGQSAFDAVTAVRDQHDVAFLLSEVPEAVGQALDGTERVSSIVKAMKAFGHPNRTESSFTDLNEALRNTVTVARNETKYVADVKLSLGNIPSVNCRVGELNQVFLNLIVNAAHAIEDVVRGTSDRGTISVRTWHDRNSVYVAIGDTGRGIPPEIRKKVFEPFFTTKEVGRGTGQGLALARTVIGQHHGVIKFDSDPTGTIFCIRLPIEGATEPAGSPGASKAPTTV